MNTQLSQPSETRLAFSRAFLNTFLLDCELRDAPDDEADRSFETSREIKLSAPRSFNGNLQEGQIRLLSQTDEITYVVLLRRWDDHSFLIAPYSQFSDPATDRELKTEQDGGAGLRVLQIWNIRTAMDETLKKSWLVGNLNPQDLQDAWRVWEWSLGGAPLESRIFERTGVPVYREDDPRLRYQQESLANFAAFDAEDEAVLERLCAEFALADSGTVSDWAIDFNKMLDIAKKWMDRFFPHGEERLIGALAAGSAPTQQTRMLRFDGGLLAVSVMGPTATLRVYDSEGNDTSALDGYSVLIKGGERLGVLTEGFFQISAEKLSGGFVLVSPENVPLALAEYQEDR